MVLEHLCMYDGITTWDAFELYGITRLSDKIYRLRNSGYNIEEEWIIKINRYGKPVSFKKYKLERED